MGAPLNVEEINPYIVYIPHLKNIHIFSPTIRYCFVFSYPICLLVFPTFFPSLSQLAIYIPLSILSVRSTWREMASRSRSWRWRILPGLQSSTSALYGTGKYARYRDVFRNQVEGGGGGRGPYLQCGKTLPIAIGPNICQERCSL